MAFTDRLANRGSISTGYAIDNSLKLEADNSEWLKSTNAHAGTTVTSSTIGTFSCWVKRTELGTNYLFVAGNSARYSRLFFNSSDQIQLYSGDGSWNSVQPITNAVYRDTAAWYHIVLRFDTTQGTAANRLRLYVNGVEQTWATAPNITQSGVMTLAEAPRHTWGANLSYYTQSAYFSGYLAEARYIDGQALAPTEFGEFDSTSGIWKPIEYDGTYGNVGYYMDFADSGNLGDDESGNGFDFDETNIAAANQATDTPTNNFCILSPLWAFTIGTTISEGGTKSVADASSGWQPAKGSIAVNNGKWYWEYSGYSSTATFIGVQNSDISLAYNSSYSVMISAADDIIYFNDPSNRTEAFATTIATTDVWAVALNMDDGEISFYRNGSLENSAVALDGLVGQGPFAPFIVQYNTNTNMYLNFGGYTADTPSSAASDANGYGAFEYAPPSGYYAICTKNLAEYG